MGMACRLPAAPGAKTSGHPAGVPAGYPLIEKTRGAGETAGTDGPVPPPVTARAGGDRHVIGLVSSSGNIGMPLELDG
ncbi:hypothetical protein Ppa06_55110 [Planomonospora parontospora subsp. parontospora]|uniref:Uncharacterized protein n=2 Tax=Planomonospora parontospora TaxID=58119 RepID=A0AA37BLV5_9ACTN|nr:hypothetical protein GCM10010126_56650 [Planomonospora parontospora]GII11713.1 hypothetical protein Ppa06_55110 [Planomonospora parontospora subsp. parontospora]